MENQLAWTATQRLINQVSYEINPGKGVVDLLKTAGVLTAAEHLHDEIITTINEIADHHHQQFSAGFCGQSLSGQIYYKLIELGHIGG